MIGLIALAIALLTLLTPAASPSSVKVAAADGTAATAMLAGQDPKLGSDPSSLLGRWEATVHFPSDGLESPLPVKTTELVMVDLGEDELGMEFGPEGERWRGEVSFQRLDGCVQFACRARCDRYPGAMAFVTGKLARGELSGVVYLDDDRHLMTWHAKRSR